MVKLFRGISKYCEIPYVIVVYLGEYKHIDLLDA